MKTNHTPGPWSYGQVRNHPYVSSSNGERIADCGPDDDNWNGWESEKQAPANARLIAAAPELLAACFTALQAVDTALCGTPSPHYFKAVKTALKVATATSIEDNLAVNVQEIKDACEKAHEIIHAAIAKATEGTV